MNPVPGSPVTGIGLALPKRLVPTDLELRPGELTCLIGPNGSGKTSLLHALAGIGRPHGKVRIGGVDPWGLGPARRSRLVSFLPASRELVWPLPARDLVALGLYGPDAKQEASLALKLLDLDAIAERRVDRLSTGERNRVLIARALAPRSQLLLLDEPTANLDPLWQLRLMDHLRRLAWQEERTMLVALHDLEAAGRYGDRLLIMQNGRVVADGAPGALLDGAWIPEVFGISRSPEGWTPVSPSRADPRSSP